MNEFPWVVIVNGERCAAFKHYDIACAFAEEHDGEVVDD